MDCLGYASLQIVSLLKARQIAIYQLLKEEVRKNTLFSTTLLICYILYIH